MIITVQERKYIFENVLKWCKRNNASFIENFMKSKEIVANVC